MASDNKMSSFFDFFPFLKQLRIHHIFLPVYRLDLSDPDGTDSD